MKSITTILAALALGTTFAVAVDEKPAAKPADGAAKTEAKPDAAKGDKPKADPAERFKKLDTNADGKISAEEWKASPAYKKDSAKADELFSKRDKDGDKSLSLEEFSAAGGKKNK